MLGSGQGRAQGGDVSVFSPLMNFFNLGFNSEFSTNIKDLKQYFVCNKNNFTVTK